MEKRRKSIQPRLSNPCQQLTSTKHDSPPKHPNTNKIHHKSTLTKPHHRRNHSNRNLKNLQPTRKTHPNTKHKTRPKHLHPSPPQRPLHSPPPLPKLPHKTIIKTRQNMHHLNEVSHTPG